MRLEWMYVKCKMYLQQKPRKTGVPVESPSQGRFQRSLPLFQIPPHGFLNALFKGCGGVPGEFALELGGVYGVAEVVAGAVGDVCDEAFAGAGWIAEEAVRSGGEDACELYV